MFIINAIVKAQLLIIEVQESQRQSLEVQSSDSSNSTRQAQRNTSKTAVRNHAASHKANVIWMSRSHARPQSRRHRNGSRPNQDFIRTDYRLQVKSQPINRNKARRVLGNLSNRTYYPTRGQYSSTSIQAD